MKKYKLLSGEVVEISPEEEEQFLLDNEGATLATEDPIDSNLEETIPPPTITEKITEPIQDNSDLLKYNKLTQKYRQEGQTDEEFLKSIQKGEKERDQRKWWQPISFGLVQFPTSGGTETTYGGLTKKELGDEKFLEFEFLYNQMNAAKNLISTSGGEYEDLTPGEVVATLGDIEKPDPAHIETYRQLSEAEAKRRELEGLPDYLKYDNTDHTNFEQDEFKNGLEEFAAEKFAEKNTEYTEKYNELINPIKDTVEKQVQSEFKTQIDARIKNLQPKVEYIQNKHYKKLPKLDYQISALKVLAQTNYSKKFPNGGTQADIDNANKELNEKIQNLTLGQQSLLDKINEDIKKEVQDLYSISFEDIDVEMNSRLNELIDSNSEVAEFKKNYEDEVEKFEKQIISDYSKEWSVDYDKWDSIFDESQSLENIGNQIDLEGFHTLNTEEKKTWLNYELQSLIERNPNIDEEDKAELAQEFFAYFADKLNKTTKIERQYKNEDGSISLQPTEFDKVGEDKEIVGPSHYFLNTLADEIISEIGEDYLKVEKYNPSIADPHGPQYYRIVGEPTDEYNKILYEVKKKYATEEVKFADLDGDGFITEHEQNIMIENDAARRYYQDYAKADEAALQWAKDVIENPEFVGDFPGGRFGAGFWAGDDTLGIPGLGGIISSRNDWTLQKAVEKSARIERAVQDAMEDYMKKDPNLTEEDARKMAEDNSKEKLNRAENLLISVASIKQQSDRMVKDLGMTMYQAGKITKHALPWMGEFIITTPAFKAAQGVMKTSLKTGLKAMIGKNISVKGGKFVLSMKLPGSFAAKHGTKIKFAEKALDGLSVLGGAAGQTWANPQRIGDELASRLTGEYIYAFSNAADETISTISHYTYSHEEGKKLGLKGQTESFEEAFVRSFAMTMSELFTERLGVYFPSWGNKVLKGINKGLGPVGKMVNNVDMWMRVTLGMYARKLGLRPGTAAFNNALKQIGWHGALSEVGEELINFPLSNLADGRQPVWTGILKYDKDDRVTGIDYQSLKELGASIGIMSGGFYGVGTVGSSLLGSKTETYWADNQRFATFEKAKERILQLQKEGRLTSETDVEIRNDWQAYNEVFDLLSKTFRQQSGINEVRRYKNKDGSISRRPTEFDKIGEVVSYRTYKDIKLEDGTIISQGTEITQKEINSGKFKNIKGRSTIGAQDLDLFIKQIESNVEKQIKTNSVKNDYKRLASETDVLNDLSNEEGKRITDLDAKLEELRQQFENNKDNPKIQDNIRRKIRRLKREVESIKRPVRRRIERARTEKQYKETLAKIKKISQDKKVKSLLDIIDKESDGRTPLNGIRAVEIALKEMGVEKFKGKWIFSKSKQELTPEQVEQMVSGEALKNMKTQHGFLIPGKYTVDGKSKMIINEEQAISKRGGNVAAHEFFHFYLDYILGENPELKLALGHVFMKYLAEIDPRRIRNSEFRRRLNQYHDQSEAVQAEESMALFIDALADGSMKYNESVFEKIGNIIRRILQKIGVNIEFKGGRDVYNWLKDFNDTVQRGEMSSNFLKEIDIQTGLIKDIEANLKVAKEKKESEEQKKIEDAKVKLEKIYKALGLSDDMIDILIGEFEKQSGKTGDIKFSLSEQDIIDKIVKKTKRPKEDIIKDNKDIYETIMQIAKDQNISPKEAAKPYLNELVENNMGLVVAEAVDKARIGRGLQLEEKKKIGFLDFFSGYSEELTKIVNTWDPLEETEKTLKNPFGTYAGSLLAIRQGQVLSGIQDKLQRHGISTTGLYQQTAEGLQERQIADVTDTTLETFEEKDISPTAQVKEQKEKTKPKTQSAIEIEGELIENVLQFFNKTKNETQQVGIDIKYDIRDKSFKDVKNDIISQAQKVNVRTRVKPTGILYDIINIISQNEFGVNPKSVLAAAQNLGKQESESARLKIEKNIKRLGGMRFLESVLGRFNMDAGGKAIGLNKATLNTFYIKGKRTDAGLNLTGQVLNPNLTDKQIRAAFGINENGTLVPWVKGLKNEQGYGIDGLVKGIITQTSILQATQVTKLQAIENIKDSYGKDVASAIEDIQDDLKRISDGKPSILFSKISEEAQDAVSLGVVDFLLTTKVDLLNTRGVNKAFQTHISKNYPDQAKIIKKEEYSIIAKTISTAVNKYNEIENKFKIGKRKIEMPISKKDYVLLSISEDAFLEKKVDKLMSAIAGMDIKSGPLFNDIKRVNKARQQLVNFIVHAKTSEKEGGLGMSEKEVMSWLVNYGEGMYWSQAKIADGRYIPIKDKKGNYTGKIKLDAKWQQIKPDGTRRTNRSQVFLNIEDALAAISEVINVHNGTRKDVIDKYEIKTKKFAENSEQGIKDKNYKGRLAQTKINRKIIESITSFYMDQIKNDNLDFGDLGMLARMFGSGMKSPMKRAANLEFIAVGAENVINPGKNLEYEHMVPTQMKILEMFKEYIENSKLRDGFWNDYTVAIIPKGMNDILNENKLRDLMPLEWETGTPSSFRYYNMYTFGNRGLVPIKSIKDGKIIGEDFVKINNLFLEGKAKKSDIQQIGKTLRLHQPIIRFSKTGERRGMSTFDFDDTLASTKSGVRARIPNIDGSPKPKRKVIFLAGGAGSGKGNVISKLGLENQGFKIVNQDISLEWLKKNHGLPENMRELTKEQRSTLGKLGHQARGIARRKMMKYQGNAEGVVVDGTGASSKQMQKLVDEFRAKGYDVSMLFVETSLETALERNRARKERSLLSIIVKKNHEAVMGNKDGFKNLFGDRFMEVNTDNLKQEDAMPSKLVNKMNDFVSSYERIRLDAEQFAAEGGDISKIKIGEFDFSEFSKVIEGKEGPFLQKALERAKKFGTKDMFVLTARPQDAAGPIQEFLKSQGLNIPLKNITGLADSTGEAKAQWMLDKFAEGYNDMYFVDDALRNVNAVKKVLDQLDVKSKVIQAGIKFSKSVNTEFNDMLERKTGVGARKIFSEAEAIKRGAKSRFEFFVPPSAEDFKGLIYKFLGKGKQGDADLKWFKENLFNQFAEGIRMWNAYKQNMANEYATLKKKFPKTTKSLNKTVPGTSFTTDAAIRTYLWNKAGFEIPGISKELQTKLINHVNKNESLVAFAEALSIISRRPDGYIEPSQHWVMQTIASDLNTITGKVGRREFLSEWIENKDVIFSKENINKIEALYGTGFKEALENILYRMEHGTNRLTGKDKNVNRFLDWINGSVGAVMFWNIRSAALQTISTVNFLNWGDNNIFKASAAFANQIQFWKDFAFIFNSDMLKQRRAGLQIDVSASELTKVFAESQNKPQAIIAWLLEKGFTPTRMADSFAIAMGGSTFYRNRVKTYIKQGLSEAKAKEKAWLDFQEIAEETQQSSRPDLISMQQAGTLGRIILAWQNTPMQMTRLTKKALSDLVNGRGDPKANISKIIYYGLVQNLIFGALQSALAFVMWGDDEEDIKRKEIRVANGALDTLLRGTGIYGAMVSTVKNTIIQWDAQRKKKYGQQDWSRVIIEAINYSPPVGSKLRKIMNAIKTWEYNKGVPEKIPYRIENPIYSVVANIIEALTNIPLARVVNKSNNVEEALTGNHELWQRIALISGWNRWDIGVTDEELEAAKEEVKEDRKEKKKIEKEQKKIDEQKIIDEDKKKEEEDKKKEGIKSVRCSGTKSNGEKCSIMVETKAKTAKCMYHRSYNEKEGSDRDGDGIKEFRCLAITKSKKRCKNRTENKSKKCYAHQ